MRILSGFCVALLAVTGLSAQNRTGFVQPLPGTPAFGGGSVVFPGGAPGLPGVQRSVGNILHPSGITPQIGVPGFRNVPGQNRFQRNGNAVFGYPVAVPVYVGGYDAMGLGAMPPAAMAPQQQPQQPNIIVIYPPAPGYSTSAGYTTSGYPNTQSGGMMPPPSNMVEAPPANQEPEPESPAHFLIAFKDHSIYSAVAYWVDGDTLHYFTSGNTHNQVSVSQVDRELTKRLNDGSGLEVKLPAAR